MLKYLSELIADTAMYAVGSSSDILCHLVQQLENGHAEWGDDGKKLKCMCALVWNSMHCSTSHKAQPSVQPWQKPGTDVMAKPGTKACAAFTNGKCVTQADHTKDLHLLLDLRMQGMHSSGVLLSS